MPQASAVPLHGSPFQPKAEIFFTAAVQESMISAAPGPPFKKVFDDRR